MCWEIDYPYYAEQQKNIAAIVWLYRGQRERFLGHTKVRDWHRNKLRSNANGAS